MIDLNNIDFYGSDLILLWGNRGHGKTLLLCYLMQSAMFQSLSFIYDVYEEIDELNKCGFNFSKKFEHNVFSNFDCNTIGTGIPDLRTYRFNPYYFGFNGKFKTIPFPPRSIFGFTELQNYYPSRMNDYIRPEVERKWQTSRHDGITIIGDVQRPYDLAKKIRDLFDYYIECYDYHEILTDGYCTGHIWNLRIIEGTRILDEYLRTNNKELCKEVKFVVKRCLYNNYDSFFCKDLHYKGFENQDFVIEHFGYGNDDVLTTPDGYFIPRKDLAKSSTDSDSEEVVF